MLVWRTAGNLTAADRRVSIRQLQDEPPTQPNFMPNLLYSIIKLFYFVRKHVAGVNLVKMFSTYM
jgi:hypothetical protein